MLDEDLINNIKTYAYYKNLILTDQAKGRNILIETKNGEFKVVPQSWLADKYTDNWEEIERITIFFKVPRPRLGMHKQEWREYEFAACSG